MRVLIDFEKQPRYFEDPVQVVSCLELADIHKCLDRLEKYLDEGFFIAGFISYEAGYAMDPRLTSLVREKEAGLGGFPLLCLGVYAQPEKRRPPAAGQGFFSVDELRSAIGRDEYEKDVNAIRSFISAGEVYQITYCRKLKFSVRGDAYGLYCKLLKSQPVPYAAYIETGPYRILSLSPEMFVQKSGTRIVTKPMKGSWPCSGAWGADHVAAWRLHRDTKNRAENVMIADLLRNDLGRIGKGIHVPRLFEVTRYRTICQMTSTVVAQVPEGLSLATLLTALFPSGSVTGAPKLRAMEIIRQLEKEPRKIYTGAIGYITPERDFFFNIPIRTIVLEGDRGELGIGGGIVWDSTPSGEWEEGEWKSRFFTCQGASGIKNV